jgi:5-methylcytosine-specific restriction endonuclease McrA
MNQDWTKARKEIINQSVAEGRITLRNGYPEGICEDCNQWKALTPDHRKKRSQGGQHTKENIDWVCWPCHDKRDNQGDPLKKKDRFKNKI